MKTAIPHDHVLTPHGLKHQSCVHQIDDVTRPLPPCQFPPKDFGVLRATGPEGWVESATFAPSQPLRSMSVTFTVPDPPSKNGALIYLFPGAEDARLSTILQPVLQYGHNGRFGGDYWTIASWHCTPLGITRHSPEHPQVQAGETILATLEVTQLSATTADWRVEAKVLGDDTRVAALPVPDVSQLLLFLVGGALEAYSLTTLKGGVDDVSQFPASGSTSFTDITLTDLAGNTFRADWNVRYPSDACGFGVNVNADRSAVTLQYP